MILKPALSLPPFIRDAANKIRSLLGLKVGMAFLAEAPGEDYRITGPFFPCPVGCPYDPAFDWNPYCLWGGNCNTRRFGSCRLTRPAAIR